MYSSHRQRCLTLQDRTDTLSQNISTKLRTNSAQHPRKARTSNKTLRFQVLKYQAGVWSMKPYRLVYRYQHNGVHCYMLRAILYWNTLKMQAVSSSKKLYLCTNLHNVISQNCKFSTLYSFNFIIQKHLNPFLLTQFFSF
jgi:hypothetical protein